MKKLAFNYLGIPGSSIPSERLFSKSGIILNKRRTLLSDKNLEMLLFLAGN